MSSTPPSTRRIPSSRWITMGSLILAIGLLATAAWIAKGDLGQLRESASKPEWIYVLALPILTLTNLALRFLRWTFFLRRINAYVPTRENLKLFVGSFALILGPLFSSEVYRAYWLRRRTGIPIRVSGAVVVSERVYDLLALLILGIFFGTSGTLWALSFVGILFLIGAFVAPRLAPHPIELKRSNERSSVLRRLQTLMLLTLQQLRPAAFSVGLALSLVAWTSASLVLTFSLRAIDGTWQVPGTITAFAFSTPLGGITLVPGGVGVTGSLMLNEVHETLNASLADATVSVILTRATTYWFAAGLGILVLIFFMKRRPDTDQTQHFEDVADDYEEEIPAHIRDHLLTKKNRFLLSRLDPQHRKGLDLGCGQGWYAMDLASKGHLMFGVDRSYGQVARARTATSPFQESAVADARFLPFPANSFDFVYCINVMHHIIDDNGQEETLAEVIRVLKPGGQFFVHEINVINPVFRFYMGYVFPLINDIDLGNEKWLHPVKMPENPKADLEGVEFFTFLPDFIPRPIFRALLPLEKRLERSRMKHLSAHFMAVYRKKALDDTPSST